MTILRYGPTRTVLGRSMLQMVYADTKNIHKGILTMFRTFVLTISALALAACNSSNDFDDDSGIPGVEPLTTGLHTLESNGVERTYYVIIPEDDSNNISASATGLKPLIFGFHGSFGSHESWVGENARYDFVDVVGNGAIMIFPDAMELADGQVNWNFAFDFLFFEDLLAELDRRGLIYDKNRLLITGHSSGAGMTSEIGCLYGDIVRAIAVSSGSLISGGSCIGAAGVIQTQGEVDQAVPINVGATANNFWRLYNGHDPDTSQPGIVEPCVDFANLDFGIEPYPVQWCQHPGGHPWTDFNSEAYWSFFSGLPEAETGTAAPPGGGNEVALGDADTTMTFTLRYPDGIPPVTSGAITLYPEDYTDGQFRSPDVFLNLNWDPNEGAPGGQVSPGEVVDYIQIPITFFVFSGEFDFSKTYKMQFSIYVEGGSSPIPTPDLDLKVLLPIQFVDKTTPIIIEETLDVTPVVPWF